MVPQNLLVAALLSATPVGQPQAPTPIQIADRKVSSLASTAAALGDPAARVLLDTHGEPLLTDFGVAKRVDRDTQITRTIALSVVSSTVMAMMWTLFSLSSRARSWSRPTRFSTKAENCFTGSWATVDVSAMA